MKDGEETEKYLIEEPTELRKRFVELEESQTRRGRAAEEPDIIADRLARAEIISCSGNWELDLTSKYVGSQ